MQVKETLNEGLKRGYNITLTAEELDTKVNDKLKEAQPDVEMKGFRKGKVPMALLKKQFGQRVMGEAMQEAIDGAMSEHFEKSGDRPAMQPEVKMTNEDWKEGDDVEVEMSYEALPAIPELDLSGIKLEKMIVKADDESIEEALASLAETAQDFKARKKGSKAKDGDQVVMDFVGKVDGEAFEGGSAEDYPLVLGSNSFIPGFEEQLVGVKTEEEKEVTVSFPDDYQAEHLKGKEAVFSCTIKEVKEAVAAEVNDEMATKFGAEDLAALKVQIGERLEAEYVGASRAVMKRGLLDALDGMVDFDLPPLRTIFRWEQRRGQIAHQWWHEEPRCRATTPQRSKPQTSTKKRQPRVRWVCFLQTGQKSRRLRTDGRDDTSDLKTKHASTAVRRRQFLSSFQKTSKCSSNACAASLKTRLSMHAA
ncbi:UNVERIFIED_CONTAM: hypothetical protein GTU68_047935 [Idotea baltica]|nr:hypothetical protein [Idotea baltica]